MTSVHAPRTAALGFEFYAPTKRFGSLHRAGRRVDDRCAPGSVHALLGRERCRQEHAREVPGRLPTAPTKAALLVDGREQRHRAARPTRGALGIGMVYQHFTVVPGMTVAENLLLARGAAAGRACRGSRDARRAAGLHGHGALPRSTLDATPVGTLAGRREAEAGDPQAAVPAAAACWCWTSPPRC
jgi:simple sugar transport system ATP-binding protein